MKSMFRALVVAAVGWVALVTPAQADEYGNAAVVRVRLPQDALQCRNIQNTDRRAYCLARAKADSLQCRNIQNNDLRSLCLAEVKGDKLQCRNIQNADLRAECLANF